MSIVQAILEVAVAIKFLSFVVAMHAVVTAIVQ